MMIKEDPINLEKKKLGKEVDQRKHPEMNSGFLFKHIQVSFLVDSE